MESHPICTRKIHIVGEMFIFIVGLRDAKCQEWKKIGGGGGSAVTEPGRGVTKGLSGSLDRKHIAESQGSPRKGL